MSENKSPISVIVITRNEERNIVACLESVQWCDDIVVVDALSGDQTVELARGFTPTVVVCEWKGFSESKAYALTLARHEWVLWLDADERVTPELAQELRNLVAGGTPPCVCYEIARLAYFLGRPIRHCGWYPGYVVRFFRRQNATFTPSRVHERLECRGHVGRLRHDLLHYTDDTLYHYFSKFNAYTGLAADDLVQSGRSFSWFALLVRPPVLFLKMFIVKRGFLDGFHGLILSLLSAAYVFIKYLKVWDRRRQSTDNDHPSIPERSTRVC